MEIRENSFLHKLYEFSDMCRQRLACQLHMRITPNKVDFCTLFRTIFIWMPLQIVLVLLAVFVPIYMLLVFPIFLSGLVGILGAIALMVIGGNYLIDKLTEVDTNKLTLTNMLSTKYRSFKDKYCPLVEVKGDEND